MVVVVAVMLVVLLVVRGLRRRGGSAGVCRPLLLLLLLVLLLLLLVVLLLLGRIRRRRRARLVGRLQVSLQVLLGRGHEAVAGLVAGAPLHAQQAQLRHGQLAGERQVEVGGRMAGHHQLVAAAGREAAALALLLAVAERGHQAGCEGDGRGGGEAGRGVSMLLQWGCDAGCASKRGIHMRLMPLNFACMTSLRQGSFNCSCLQEQSHCFPLQRCMTSTSVMKTSETANRSS